MTFTVSSKLASYAALGAAGLLLALVWGRPEAAVLGLPFIVATLTGLAMVVMMVVRPRGFVSTRSPSIFLKERRAVSGDLVKEGHG